MAQLMKEAVERAERACFDNTGFDGFTRGELAQLCHAWLCWHRHREYRRPEREDSDNG